MLVYKQKIKFIENIDFIAKKQLNYNYALRKLYKHYTEQDIEAKLRQEFNLDSWEYESLKTDLDVRIILKESHKLEKLNEIENLNEEIIELKNSNNKTKKESRELYKARNKLARLTKNIDNELVFGGVNNLRNISYYRNTNKLEQETNARDTYNAKRLVPFCIGGETHHNGNRKFDFYLIENKLVYKPICGTKLEIEFLNKSKKKQKILNKLQEAIDTNEILPVTIKLSTEYIWIHFDEQKLYGYSFNKTEYKKKQKDAKTKEDTKQLKIEFYKEQESRMFADKILSRYAAVDLNPCNIGFCIVDSESNKIINTVNYDLKNLSTKLRLSSDDPKQNYQNNKRKYEITKVWQQIFNICKANKVSHFVIEDLNFKVGDAKIGREFNRKTKGVWHRSLTMSLINKYCNIGGIRLVEVSPVYSSFIGNLRYCYFDAVNSALEICRRGIFKFVAGCSVYPELCRSDVDAMSRLLKEKLRDDQHKTIQVKDALSKIKTWKDSYKLLRQSEFKGWRRRLEDCTFDLRLVSSIKSTVMKEIF